MDREARDQNRSATAAAATASYRKQLEDVEKVWQKIGQTIEDVSGKFVDFMFDGKQSFAEFTNAVLKDLTKIILKEILAAAIKSALGGGGGSFGSFFHTGATQSFEGQYGGLPHAAEGGSWMIRNGPSAGDRNLFGVLVNAGERVDVVTREQQQAGGAGGKRIVHVHLGDRSEAEFEDMVIRVVRRNPAIMGSVTGR